MKGITHWTALLLVLVGTAIVYFLSPLVSKDGIWTHIVLRNWEDFGFLRLNGKLVANPGGNKVLEEPQIYSGHRAYALYPSYWIGHLVGGAGTNGLPFFLFLTLVVWVGSWWLLGKDCLATVTAFTVVFSPGYVRCNLNLDPLAIPVWLGVPIAAIAIKLLDRNPFPWKLAPPVALLLFGYSCLNWTTVFALGITAAALAVLLRWQWKKLLLFAGSAGVGVALIGLVSVLDKMGHVTAGDGDTQSMTARLAAFNNGYLVGSGGYAGFPMTWSRAAVRLVIVNFIAALPLLGVFTWASVRHFRRSRGSLSWSPFLPLLIGMLGVAGMRNYFAHHPWMAAPVVMFAVLFSLRLLLNEKYEALEAVEGSGGIRTRDLLPTVALCSFAYCLSVISIERANTEAEDSLSRLVKTHTHRSDLIVISKETDPGLASKSVRLADLFDRKTLIVSNSTAIGDFVVPAYQVTAFMPKAAIVPGAFRTGENESAIRTLLNTTLGWYRRHVARRSKGDRLDIASTYYLYKVADHPAPHEAAKPGSGVQ